MPSIHKIQQYFPLITDGQLLVFQKMEELYIDWNKKVNVVSRKDMDNIFEHHILHSLSIAHFFNFEDGSNILDVGTGGGFPGIPLAALFPKCNFTLIDSIGKKIMVVNDIAAKLDLGNVQAKKTRSEGLKGNYDYIVSRAVTNLPDFIKQTWHLIKKGKGMLYLKGGDFVDELNLINKPVKLFNLSEYFKEQFFETKKIVFVSNKA